MDNALFEEWKREMSSFARSWLAQMVGAKKLVPLGDPDTDAGREMRARLLESGPRVADDAKLVESALLADSVLISMDCEARMAVATLCADFRGVADVVWACPEHHQGVAAWLRSGAPGKDEWRLGCSGRDAPD